MPGYKKFFRALSENHIHNCPITLDDAKRALHIYGPDTAHLQGKTTRDRPAPIPITDLTPIPRDVIEAQRFVNLSMDYFFVQGIPALHTISRNIHFRTVEFLLNKNKGSEADTRAGVARILPLYNKRGLQVTRVNADNEFDNLEDTVHPANLHIVGANEHVGDIERSIRAIKECTRCHVHRLPYTRYPKLMVAGMILHIVKSLNNLPSETGIQGNISPATLITGCGPLKYESLMQLNFGDYVHAHETKQVTNDQSRRTVGAIALYPRSENSWMFMSLETGQKIHRYSWTVLPVTDDVTDRVH